MFKMTLLKHFMPIALSVCMVVQSVPATAFAAEQTETTVEETVSTETDTNESSGEETPETNLSPVTAAQTPETENVTEETNDTTQETSDEEDSDTEVSTKEQSSEASTGGGYPDKEVSDVELSDESLSNASSFETTEAEASEETSLEEMTETEVVEDISSSEEASEEEETENDLMETASSETEEITMSTAVTDEVAALADTTDEDTRKLTFSKIATGYSYAVLSASLTENTDNTYTYLRYYYRKKGDTSWTSADYDITSNSSYDFHAYFTDYLEYGTTYEYAIIAGSYSDNASSLETIPSNRKLQGEFTTKSAPVYTFTFEPVEDKCTYDTEVLNVTASGSDDNAKLDVILTLNDGSESYVSLKSKADYTNTVTFEGLSAKTEYTIVKAVVETTEQVPYNDYELYLTFNPIDLQAKFTTKEVVVPTSIAIVDSDKELKLTKLYDAYNYSNTMEVNVTPEDASTDMIWSSSDNSVARIAYIDGNKAAIVACGVGEATITATSSHDPTKKAERKVIVKDYQVILTDSGNSTNSVGVYKKSNDDPTKKVTYVFTDINFCEVSADGTKTPLTDFNVTSDKPNVADWGKTDEGQFGIASYAVGTTRMTFEKDGYKATINVTVKAESKGFGITGLTPSYSYSAYPAIDRGDDTYEIAFVSGISYTASGMISPKETFYPSNFEWKSSDETVATVSNGIITPLKKGEVTITVKPIDETKFTKTQECSFKVIIKEVPPCIADGTPTVYALTNTTKTLADVQFPESWGTGWVWRDPATSLYNIPVSSSSYAFEANYTGDTYYAYEGTTVRVYVGTITGVYAYEADNTHNGVLTTATGDSLTLRVIPDYMGSISDDLYTISTPTVKGNGLTITPAKDATGEDIKGQYVITASAVGKYTLGLEIKAGDKVVATGKYILTVAESQVDSILLQSADETAAKIESNMISFDFGKETKEFKLTAEAYDRILNNASDATKPLNTTTKLNWTITDKSVATLKVEKDTRSATITVKGEGHAVIQVTAQDTVGVSAQLKLEIRNHAPRVEGSKTTINTAFDYETSSGRNLSRYLYGTIEVVPVYSESISNVSIVNEDGTTASTNFEPYQISGNYYIIMPKSGATVSPGTYKCHLAVKTSENETPYTYPVTVSVINKQPKVTAKITQSMNLFYITEQGEAEVKLENTYYSIESLTWEDGSTGANGFDFSSNGYTKLKKASNFKYYSISQTNVKVTNGKLADDKIAQGKLTIKLNGVKESYTFDNIKIKYNYKKPTLKTLDTMTRKNVSSIVPSMNATDAGFYLYDNLHKHYLYYSDYNTSCYYYDELICDNANVDDIDAYDSYIYFNYTGDKKQDTLPLTVDSSAWRERLTVNHKVKVIQPKAVLSNAKLTYNTNYMNEASTYIKIKDYGYINFTDIAINGANAKSQALLDDDRLQLMHSYSRYSDSYSDAYGDCVYARLNKLKVAADTVPSGSYSYNLTPYYTDSATGEKKALNTVKLTITFTDKPVTAKASAKGAIDLAQRNATYIRLTPKFSNMGYGYSVTNIKLIGEYSNYFKLVREDSNYSYPNGVYDLKASSNSGNLKSGHTYNLAIVYTIQTTGGETFTVTSNKFKVKPKQTAPKITVTTKPQTLYAAANDLTRSYRITVPSTYSISSASGSIDINKDGRADITVSSYSYGSGYAYLTVRIADKDAVIAAPKGKSYSIPITVRVTGRDGISKDASTKIKVTIKR